MRFAIAKFDAVTNIGGHHGGCADAERRVGTEFAFDSERVCADPSKKLPLLTVMQRYVVVEGGDVVDSLAGFDFGSECRFAGAGGAVKDHRRTPAFAGCNDDGAGLVACEVASNRISISRNSVDELLNGSVEVLAAQPNAHRNRRGCNRNIDARGNGRNAAGARH